MFACMADEIRVRAEILEEMLRHARREPEVECCGALAGRDVVITKSFPAINVLASPVAYEISPQELFRIFHRMREEGLEHLAFYHSHPLGENFPSARDIAQAYYPNEAYFIISPQVGVPRPVRAFSIRDDMVRELRIEIAAAGL
jgi:proteasome lid subunit RPN8/RPN11